MTARHTCMTAQRIVNRKCNVGDCLPWNVESLETLSYKKCVGWQSDRKMVAVHETSSWHGLFRNIMNVCWHCHINNSHYALRLQGSVGWKSLLSTFKPSFVIFDIRALWRLGLCQSAQMSKITNDGLTRSATGCFIAVPTWQQLALEG